MITLLCHLTGLYFNLDTKWKNIDGGDMTIQMNELFDWEVY